MEREELIENNNYGNDWIKKLDMFALRLPLKKVYEVLVHSKVIDCYLHLTYKVGI